MIKKLLHEIRQLGGILRNRRNGVASIGLLRQSVLLQKVAKSQIDFAFSAFFAASKLDNTFVY